MIPRLIVLAAVIGAVWLAIRFWEQRRTATGDFQPGLTVITADGCTLCVPAVEALRGTGTDAPIRVVDVADAGIEGILSVPTVLAVHHSGRLVMQRSGTSAITDAPALAAAIA